MSELSWILGHPVGVQELPAGVKKTTPLHTGIGGRITNTILDLALNVGFNYPMAMGKAEEKLQSPWVSWEDFQCN